MLDPMNLSACLRAGAYAGSFSEQKGQLCDDAFMQAAKTARAERYADARIPVYHYVNACGFMNDPNAFFYYRGRWHLFYQQMCGRAMVWGHAVSSDLVHFTELPYAITPEPERSEESCWSGSGFADDEKGAYVAYFGYRGKEGLYFRRSHDDLLLDWKREGDGPAVAQATEHEETYRIPYAAHPEVYDGTVFYENGKYYALSAGVERRADGTFIRQLSLYSSDDFERWHYEHPFLKGDVFGSVGDDCACPFLAKLGDDEDTYELLFFSHRNGPEYMVGTLDKNTMRFSVRGADRIDPVAWFGGYAAPALTRGPDGLCRAFYIMHGGEGCVSCMSLPHVHTLRDTQTLCASPAPEVLALRQNERRLPPVSVLQGEECVIPGVRGDAIEIALTLRFDLGTTPELRLFRSEDGKEYVSVAFYRQRGPQYRDADDWHRTTVMEVRCLAGGEEQKWQSTPECVPIPLEPGEPLSLRIFLDRSVLEIFPQGGMSIGKRVLPSVGADTFSVIAHGGDVEISEAAVWDMKPVSPDASDAERIK